MENCAGIVQFGEVVVGFFFHACVVCEDTIMYLEIVFSDLLLKMDRARPSDFSIRKHTRMHGFLISMFELFFEVVTVIGPLSKLWICH